MEARPALTTPLHWFERFPRALPVAIFVLISAITLFAVVAIESTVKNRRSMQLSQTAKLVASALERRGDAHDAFLRSGAAFFASQPQVSAEVFAAYLSELQLDGDFKGAEGIGWGQLVDRNGISEFEDAMRRTGRSDRGIWPKPATGQSFAVPVTHIQPDTPANRKAIGFNMYSEPIRREAMDEAVRRGRPTASRKVVLIQERNRGSNAPGFIIYMPVLGRDADGARTLKGFVYSPIVAREFLASALRLEQPGEIGVRLYCQSGGSKELLAQVPPNRPSGEVQSLPVEIAGHRWLLEVESVNRPGLAPLSLVTLLFGLLVAGVLLALSRMITRRSAENSQALAWFEEQASIRNSLTRELNHRVKNTLANVLSIVSLTRRRATDIDSFATGLEGRIRALSATHDLLTQSEWGTTPIRSVVSAELSPFARDGEQALDLHGPAVELAPNDALSLGLAMHELATNAAKFGAFSVPGGKVSIAWELIAPDRARVEWSESGGPPVIQERRRRGFGTELIEKIVAHELRNPVDLRFEREGVRCVLILPVRRPTEFAMRAVPRSAIPLP